ncbi:MAG: hypothetical protein WAU53_18285 [Rhodoplanes sp.]
MFKLKSLLVIGTSAFIAGAAVSFSGDLSARFVGVADASAGAKAAVTSVDRTRKSDRLTATQAARKEARTISAVEVVGIRDAAIIYRDRDGRVLYQSDPLSNATLVMKGVVLPEVTVRDKAGSAVRSVTNNAPKTDPTVDSRDQRKPVGVAPQSNERRPRIPEGCDAAASPIAAPQLSHILSKCLV